MHIEIQVALNFVISYLYNKLPRRRVNIFGEELEKALRDKFQGHWYPEKPFKGSAFRCLKTGDPTDAVLDRAARESGVPIADILENLPNELSVWIDPGEVSYRIGEKGAVKILYSENSDNHEDNTSADREVNKTFNPEAQCFRPIDAVNTSMNSLSLSPKTSPQSGSSPHSASSTSPTAYKGSPNVAVQVAAAAANAGNGQASNNAGGSDRGVGGGAGIASNAAFLQRHHVPLTFTTATFAQTKFGSTKLKTSSKRTNSSSYRMSPTEFSNYIKQRAMQQQQVHHHGPHHGGINGSGGPPSNHQFGAIGPVSPARSLSPNPMALPMGNGGNSAGTQNHADPFYFPNMAMGMYPPFNGHRNLFEAPPHFPPHAEANGFNGMGLNGGANHGKFNNGYLEPHAFYGMPPHMGPSSPQPNGGLTAKNLELLNNKEGHNNNAKTTINAAAGITVTITSGGGAATNTNSNETQLSVSPIPSLNLTDASPSASLHGSNNAIASPSSASSAASNASSLSSSNNSMSNASSNSSAASSTSSASSASSNSSSASSKLIDGLNSFYSNATGSYQQLLVAN